MTVLKLSEEYLVCNMKLESPDQVTDCEGWKLFTVNEQEIVVYLKPIIAMATRTITVLSSGNQSGMGIKEDKNPFGLPSTEEIKKDLTPPDDPNWGKPPVEKEPKLKPPAPRLPRMTGNFTPAPPLNSDGTVGGGRCAGIIN